jgi:hypothetical protein
VTVMGACDAEDRFLPPVAIFDGTQRENRCSGAGCEIYVNLRKVYINTDLFAIFLKEILCQKVLLEILHANFDSHPSSPDLL